MQHLLDFTSVLRGMDSGLMWQVANSAPNAEEYLFSTSILPVELRADFNISGARMKWISTMAGLVGMDSLPMETGGLSGENWYAMTAKIGAMSSLNEVQQRELLERAKIQALGMGLGNQTHEQLLTNAALGMWQKGVIQPMDDTVEWMCATAVMTGRLKWSFNGNHLDVDYGIPADNTITVPASEWFDQTGSQFWNYMNQAEAKLNYSVRAVLTDDATLNGIINQPVNRVDASSDVRSRQGNIRRVDIRKTIRNSDGDIVAYDNNARSSKTLWSYSRVGQIYAPDRTLVKIPMMPANKIALIGYGAPSGYALDGTPESVESQRLGYYHRGPTIEGHGALGRWTRIWTPENYPQKVQGEGYENGLPIVESPDQIVYLVKGS